MARKAENEMRFELALVETIYESLVAGEPLHVPGLGTFSIAHEPAHTYTDDSGAYTVRPPQDRIRFTELTTGEELPEFTSR